jgi:hypothetical protein
MTDSKKSHELARERQRIYNRDHVLCTHSISYNKSLFNYLKILLNSSIFNKLPPYYIDLLYGLNNIRNQIIPLREDIDERINYHLENVQFKNGKDDIFIINPYTREGQNISKKKPRLYKAWKLIEGLFKYNLIEFGINNVTKYYKGIFGEEYNEIHMVTRSDKKYKYYEFVGFVYPRCEYEEKILNCKTSIIVQIK